jgi:hypothetical protein
VYVLADSATVCSLAEEIYRYVMVPIKNYQHKWLFVEATRQSV